jgi:hypothetical protein
MRIVAASLGIAKCDVRRIRRAVSLARSERSALWARCVEHLHMVMDRVMSWTFGRARSDRARVRRLLELNVVGMQTMLSFLVCASISAGVFCAP